MNPNDLDDPIVVTLNLSSMFLCYFFHLSSTLDYDQVTTKIM